MKYWEKPFGREKPQVFQGSINIFKDRCKGCGFCIEFCPNNVLDFSNEFNKKGYHPPEIIFTKKCTYCGLCESICPDSAIFVIREEVK